LKTPKRPRKPPCQREGYIAKVFNLTQLHPSMFRPGKLTMINVFHEPSCASNDGQDCNCDPDVRFDTDQDSN